MVNTVNSSFREELVEGAVERLCRYEIASKRLFNHHAGIICTTGLRQSAGNCGKHTRRNCKIMNRPVSITEHTPQPTVCGFIAVISINILKKAGQGGECIRIQTPVVLNAVACALFQLIEIPATLGNTNDRHRGMAMSDHRLKSREDLLVS